MKLAMLLLLATIPASAQINVAVPTNRAGDVSSSPPGMIQTQTNQMSIVQRAQQMRAACIENRRSICGKILKVLPDGLVIESGYTNLLRSPLDRSWIVPGTVTASRAPNLIELNEPGAICVGLVFLADTPKSRRVKVNQYDYVVIQAYPAGQYIYTSVGDVRRTVRRFSASLENAVGLNLQAEDGKAQPRAAEVK